METKRQSRTDRHPPRAVCQVTEDEQSPVESPETELSEDIIRKLLPTSSPLPPEAAPIPSDQDLLIQRLMGAICPSQPVAQARSKLTDLETMLLNWLPVGTVTEEDAVRFRRGVFFVRGFDPYDGSMSESRRVISIFASRMAGGSHRGPVHSRTGSPVSCGDCPGVRYGESTD